MKHWRHKYDVRGRAYQKKQELRCFSSVPIPRFLDWIPVEWKWRITLARYWPRAIFQRFRVLDAKKDNNCHGHALGLDFWLCANQPEWPTAIKSERLPNWLRAARRLGFVETKVETEAIACLYVDQGGFVKHSTKRLSNGRYESKLGAAPILVSNHRLNLFAGNRYGYPTVFLRKS